MKEQTAVMNMMMGMYMCRMCMFSAADFSEQFSRRDVE